MERIWEKRERQEKRRNVVVMGFKVEGKSVKVRIKEILDQIEANVEVEKAR